MDLPNTNGCVVFAVSLFGSICKNFSKPILTIMLSVLLYLSVCLGSIVLFSPIEYCLRSIPLLLIGCPSNGIRSKEKCMSIQWNSHIPSNDWPLIRPWDTQNQRDPCAFDGCSNTKASNLLVNCTTLAQFKSVCFIRNIRTNMSPTRCSQSSKHGL